MLEYTHIPCIPSYFRNGDYDITPHGYEELRNDNIPIKDLENAIGDDAPEVIEDYYFNSRGASCLILAWHSPESPIHVQVAYWAESPIVVTAYRPDNRWEDDCKTRRRVDND